MNIRNSKLEIRMLAVWLFVASFAMAADNGPVEIELRANGSANGTTITLGDVATLSGGPAALRDRLSRLDVSEIPSSGAAITLKRTQIEFRLKLAEVPAALYHLSGASETKVSAARPGATSDQIVTAARSALVRRLNYSPDDVSIRLVQPVSASLPAGEAADIRIAAESHTPDVSLGRVQMDVSVTERGERRLSVPVYFEVRPIQRVAVCRTAIAKGAALNDDNVTIERRTIESNNPLPNADTVIGAVAKKPIRAGELITTTDVDQPNANPVLIKCRQPVKMIVHLGAVNVVAGGEALQEGRLGQMIRVQNTESKKIVSGRVSAAGTVDVESGVLP